MRDTRPDIGLVAGPAKGEPGKPEVVRAARARRGARGRGAVHYLDAMRARAAAHYPLRWPS